jgi:histidine triad (HIT) family protein
MFRLWVEVSGRVIELKKEKKSKMSDSCIFCKIITKQAPADFIFEDEHVVVIKDIHPHSPTHLLIVPREHIRSVNDLTKDSTNLVAHMVFVGQHVAKQQGIANSGYKLLFNVERGGGQVIFHLHLHLMGGWK